VANNGYVKSVGYSTITTDFHMLFDIGSTYNWVMGGGCAVGTYNPGAVAQPWTPSHWYVASCSGSTNYTYPEGNVTGCSFLQNVTFDGMLVFNDQIAAGQTAQSVVLQNQTLIMASSVQNDIPTNLYSSSSDGYYGLGLSNGNCTFLDGLVAAGYTNQRSFSMFMTLDPYGADYYSEIVINGNDSRYTKSNNWTTLPNANPNSWSITVSNASVGANLLANTSSTAHLSSVNPKIVMPPAYYTQVLQQLVASGLTCNNGGGVAPIVCQCTDGDYSTFPSLNIMSGSANFSLDPLYYVYYDAANYYGSNPTEQVNVANSFMMPTNQTRSSKRSKSLNESHKNKTRSNKSANHTKAMNPSKISNASKAAKPLSKTNNTNTNNTITNSSNISTTSKIMMNKTKSLNQSNATNKSKIVKKVRIIEAELGEDTDDTDTDDSDDSEDDGSDDDSSDYSDYSSYDEWTSDYSDSEDDDYFSEDDIYYGTYGYSYPVYYNNPIIIYNGGYYTANKQTVGDLCHIQIDTSASYNTTPTFDNTQDWILGAPFMQAFYTQFDADNLTVSFAEASQPIHFWHHVDHSRWWIWALVGTGVIGLVICCYCTNSKKGYGGYNNF
jgi:hypothetical protein